MKWKNFYFWDNCAELMRKSSDEIAFTLVLTLQHFVIKSARFVIIRFIMVQLVLGASSLQLGKQ